MNVPRGIGLCVFAGALITGCSSVKVEPSPQAAENLRKIVLAYNNAVGKNKKPPQNLEQLKPFLQELGDPDELLRSPDDHEPYVIIYGVTSFSQLNPTGAIGAPVVIAHERRGSEGIRFVATTMGNVTQMTEAEFQKAQFPPGYKPGS